MEVRNPVYNKQGSIDCEINHPEYGWIPFTASSNDIELHGREIYNIVLEMNPDTYVEPIIPSPSIEELAETARLKRNTLLSQSDWTQISDAPTSIDKSSWAIYRQQLRDLTLQEEFPENIIWPNPPTTT